MSDDLILQAAYAVVMPCWAALILAPKAAPTRWLCGTGAVSLLLAALYLVLVVNNQVAGGGQGDFGSMDGLMRLFSNRRVVLIGWVHYLAFDLFVGTWVATDGARRGLSRWLVGPCLFFVLMLGPMGLLMYAALCRVRTGEWRVFSTGAQD